MGNNLVVPEVLKYIAFRHPDRAASKTNFPTESVTVGSTDDIVVPQPPPGNLVAIQVSNNFDLKCSNPFGKLSVVKTVVDEFDQQYTMCTQFNPIPRKNSSKRRFQSDLNSQNMDSQQIPLEQKLGNFDVRADNVGGPVQMCDFCGSNSLCVCIEFHDGGLLIKNPKATDVTVTQSEQYHAYRAGWFVRTQGKVGELVPGLLWSALPVPRVKLDRTQGRPSMLYLPTHSDSSKFRIWLPPYMKETREKKTEADIKAAEEVQQNLQPRFPTKILEVIRFRKLPHSPEGIEVEKTQNDEHPLAFDVDELESSGQWYDYLANNEGSFAKAGTFSCPHGAKLRFSVGTTLSLGDDYLFVISGDFPESGADVSTESSSPSGDANDDDRVRIGLTIKCPGPVVQTRGTGFAPQLQNPESARAELGQ